MKLYKQLDIGTAKPEMKIRDEIAHHLIDIKEPWESCTVAEFLRRAEAVIDVSANTGRALIAEGGTALYLKALCEGLFEGPGCNPEIRKQFEEEAAQIGVPALHARLLSIDPKAGARILVNDIRRIVRALEVHALTGFPISHFQSQWGVARADLDVRMVCLRLPREVLYKRIDSRIGAMIESGWVDECRTLLDLPQPLSREASQALGYRTLFAYIKGEMSLAAAMERICFDTHHFARKQIGWYKRLPGIVFVDIDPDEPAERIAKRVLEIWTHWRGDNE